MLLLPEGNFTDHSQQIHPAVATWNGRRLSRSAQHRAEWRAWKTATLAFYTNSLDWYKRQGDCPKEY